MRTYNGFIGYLMGVGIGMCAGVAPLWITLSFSIAFGVVLSHLDRNQTGLEESDA